MIKIFTDGSCLSNPGPGGYCALIQLTENSKLIEISGGEENTTNNRMEILAVIKGLEYLKEQNIQNQNIELYTDSQYVVNSINTWLAGWEQKNYKDVKNPDLWKQIAELKQIYHITAYWVKGHAGHPQNELCDTIANNTAKSFAKQKTKLTEMVNGNITIAGEFQEEFENVMSLLSEPLEAKIRDCLKKLNMFEN